MKRIKKEIGNLTIGKKIVFYTYIVIVPLLVLIYIGVTAYRYYTTREEYEMQQKDGIYNLTLSLNIVEEDVRYLSLNLAINQEIQDILNSQDAETLNTDAQLWKNRTSLQTFEDIIALKGYIKTLSIYPENGVIPYLRCIDSSSSYLSDLEEVKKTDAYKQSVELNGMGLWISVPKGSGEIYQVNRSEKLVLCRAMYNQSRSRLLGYLTIGISQEMVEELCSSVLDSDQEGVILLDRNGNEIISYGHVEDELRQYLQDQNIMTKEEYYGSKDGWEIYTGPASNGGWHVCKVLPRKGFMGFFNEIVYIPLFMLFGIGIGILPVIGALSRRITKPLQTVCKAMEQFRQGDFRQQVEIGTNDEVGQVAACFNQMVTDIRELINRNYIMVLKERESELAVLQAQINPHFLYNALDSIYWQAINEDDEVTAESIYELSQLFRLVLGQGKELVTVEMEMELLQRYLEIQKLRFQEQVEYKLEMDKTIGNKKIPKLILQPFVENALIHGMQSEKEDFLVTVTARPDGAYLEFLIKDTGVGMDEEQLRRIWEEDADKVFTGQKIGRYAIKNVKERLKLKYEDQFSLDISSKLGEGTLVCIRIPAEDSQDTGQDRGNANGIKVIDSGR